MKLQVKEKPSCGLLKLSHRVRDAVGPFGYLPLAPLFILAGLSCIVIGALLARLGYVGERICGLVGFDPWM